MQAARAREQEMARRLSNQQSIYEEQIKTLRVDLQSLKNSYIKLEKNSSMKPEKYKRALYEKKNKLELSERYRS